MYPQRYQEFLDFLDSNPEYLHDMRVRLLTPDLIALPETIRPDGGHRRRTRRKVHRLCGSDGPTADRNQGGRGNNQGGRGNNQGGTSGTLKSDVATLKTSTGTLVRSDLERRAREIILNIARDALGLTKGRILVARGKDTAPAFLESIEGAEEDGLITEEQEGDVLFADIIIRARRTHNKEYVHAVFEVSRTIRNNDIERAAERAAAVTAATGQETIAAVIGERIQPPQQALAEQTGVRVILPAVFTQNDEPLAA